MNQATAEASKKMGVKGLPFFFVVFFCFLLGGQIRLSKEEEFCFFVAPFMFIQEDPRR